ncbi:MFS transporter [Nocardioides pantholopis]|uniref:MFS transporter n=1 Tax=Nocardioides pantholopis TaxID=2483798 RepID=UPI001F14FB03|nr:MFS transporter [Nocardioides pantholopis]
MANRSVETAVDRASTPRAWGLLMVVCGALFLEGIDIAMLNVAVPVIAADVGLSAGAAHWVISAYVLGYAGFMLLGGRTADLVGRRRVFLVALSVFVVFSALGGLADVDWVLVLARFATGVSAGFLTPAGFSLVATTFPEGPLRDRALVVYGSVGAAGFVLGTVAGGVLASASWRLVFFGPAVLGLLLLGAGAALIRPDEQSPTPGGFDVGGAVTATAGMVAVVYAVIAVGEGGGLGPAGLAVAAAIVLLGAFVAIESRHRSPLLRLGMLREGLLLHVSIAGLLFMGAFFGFQFAVTLYLQDLRGWSPLEAGLTFAIMGLDLVAAPLLTPPLVRWFGAARVMTVGFVAAAVAFGRLVPLGDDWSYVDFLPSLLLVAAAFALVYGPLTSLAAEGVPESEQGAAGGVVYTAFQFGGALGLAGVTVALNAGHADGAVLGDYQRALIVPTLAAVAAVVVGVLAVVRRRQDGTTGG